MRDLKQILKELNNFENKYKISLLDVISAVENGIYDIYGKFYEGSMFYIDLENESLKMIDNVRRFYFKDFNKKWVLNKEN